MNNMVAIVDFKQACAYIGSGIKPKDVAYDWDKKVMVFYFDKQETAEVWNKWKNREFDF